MWGGVSVNSDEQNIREKGSETAPWGPLLSPWSRSTRPAPGRAGNS